MSVQTEVHLLWYTHIVPIVLIILIYIPRVVQFLDHSKIFIEASLPPQDQHPPSHHRPPLTTKRFTSNDNDPPTRIQFLVGTEAQRRNPNLICPSNRLSSPSTRNSLPAIQPTYSPRLSPSLWLSVSSEKKKKKSSNDANDIILSKWMMI